MVFCDNRTGFSRSILINPTWLMIAFLEKRITCIGIIALIIRLLYNDFKIWKLTKNNWKLYIFTYVLIIIIINIWISLFIKWCNLYFLKGTMKKIPENTFHMCHLPQSRGPHFQTSFSSFKYSISAYIILVRISSFFVITFIYKYVQFNY